MQLAPLGCRLRASPKDSGHRRLPPRTARFRTAAPCGRLHGQPPAFLNLGGRAIGYAIDDLDAWLEILPAGTAHRKREPTRDGCSRKAVRTLSTSRSRKIGADALKDFARTAAAKRTGKSRRQPKMG